MASPKLPAPGNLSDRVVRYLIDYTRRHHLPCGAEVPSEGHLSEKLHVSRGVVREAYRSLKTAGVLDISNGRSPRVGRISNRGVAQFLEHALYTDQATPEQVFDIRRSIEVRAAELAAINRTTRDADQLQLEAETMRASVAQRRRFTNADIRFHETLGRATGNPLFQLLSSALFESLALTIRVGFDSRSTTEERDRVAQIHINLAGAIKAGDPDEARRRMILHFEEAQAFVTRYPAESVPRRTTAGRLRRM